jgi:hypothetical protein
MASIGNCAPELNSISIFMDKFGGPPEFYFCSRKLGDNIK